MTDQEGSQADRERASLPRGDGGRGRSSASVPVCHVLAGDKIYFGSGDDGRKVKNLRDNPQIAVTIDLYSDDWSQLRGVMVQGTARLIERGPRFKQALAALREVSAVREGGCHLAVGFGGGGTDPDPRLHVGPRLAPQSSVTIRR